MENKVFYTPSGEEVIPTYQKELVDGVKQLVETGTKNIYDEIQVSKDDCDIRKIIERSQCGDLTALNARPKAIYGDFTNTNVSINELNGIQKEAQSNYDKLTEAEKAIVDKYLKGEKIEQEQTEQKESVNE